MNDTKTPATQVVFADTLAKGSVIVEQCEGRSFNGTYLLCTTEATTHRSGEAHHLAVSDLRVANGSVNAIVVDEDGEQQPWHVAANRAVRVVASTPTNHP